MNEKKLQLVFAVEGGKETSMTLSMAKQDLDGTTVKAAMQAMVDSLAFATANGEAYTAPKSAAYVTTTETELFNDAV